MARFTTFRNGKKVNPVIEEYVVSSDLTHAPKGNDGLNVFKVNRRIIVTFVLIGKTIGLLKASLEWNGNYVVYFIATDIDHRRQGIATLMWNELKQHCSPEHSREITDLGSLWINSLENHKTL